MVDTVTRRENTESRHNGRLRATRSSRDVSRALGEPVGSRRAATIPPRSRRKGPQLRTSCGLRDPLNHVPSWRVSNQGCRPWLYTQSRPSRIRHCLRARPPPSRLGAACTSPDSFTKGGGGRGGGATTGVNPRGPSPNLAHHFRVASCRKRVGPLLTNSQEVTSASRRSKASKSALVISTALPPSVEARVAAQRRRSPGWRHRAHRRLEANALRRPWAKPLRRCSPKPRSGGPTTIDQRKSATSDRARTPVRPMPADQAHGPNRSPNSPAPRGGGGGGGGGGAGQQTPEEIRAVQQRAARRLPVATCPTVGAARAASLCAPTGAALLGSSSVRRRRGAGGSGGGVKGRVPAAAKASRRNRGARAALMKSQANRPRASVRNRPLRSEVGP
jgi:hypothetical protein